MKQGEKTQKIAAKYYVIACVKEKDASNITLSNCINSTNVHLYNYCTKIFIIVVKTCGCRRSVDNKAAILSYPILLTDRAEIPDLWVIVFNHLEH